MATLRALVLSILTAAMIGVGGLAIVGSAPTHAAEGDEPPPQKTRRVPSISEAVFKKLSEAQEKIDAKDFNGARGALQPLLTKKGINRNEIGQVHNMLGYVEYSRENYTKAIDHYKQVVAQGKDIPEGLEVTTLYTLAQLSFVTERYQDALRYMEQWIAKANNPGPEPHIFMGQVYYQMKQYPKAITQIETGIRVARERATPIKEQWWSLLTFLYYEQENWPKVLEILEILVRDFPKRDYWLRLAGVYGQENQEKKQLHTMDAAYVAGYVDRERDLTNYAALLMQAEVPYRAAKVLEKGINDKTIERTSTNLRSLGQAWQLAQEVDKAIPVFEDSAKLADDGKIYERLANLYLEDDAFGKCVTAANNALRKGGLRKSQVVHMIRGMCLYNQDKLSTARKSFENCRNQSQSREDTTNVKVCQQWITYVDRESNRRAELARALREEQAPQEAADETEDDGDSAEAGAR